MGTLRDMQKSEEERSGQPVDRAALGAGYQALADAERWASVGAGAPRFAVRLAAADAAAAAHARLAAGARPQGPDPLLDEAEARVRPGDWWEALAKAFHWQEATARAYAVEVDPGPQQWAADLLADAAADPALADRLELVRRRLAGEELVLRHALGTL